MNDAALLARIIEDYDEYSEPSSFPSRAHSGDLLRLYAIVPASYLLAVAFSVPQDGFGGDHRKQIYNPVGELLIASDFHLRMAPSLERRLKKKDL